MGPLELYTIVGGAPFDSVASLAGHRGYLEMYRSLGPLVRVGMQFAGCVLVTMLVFGLIQNYGTNAVAKSRQSPVISLCVGVPSLLVVGGLTSTGIVITDTSVGVFFAIPLVVLGVAVLPAATVIGLVAIGRTAAARLGHDRLVVGALVGAVLSGIAGVSMLATVGLAALAAALGIGAAIRVLFGATGSARPDERAVPPANKI